MLDIKTDLLQQPERIYKRKTLKVELVIANMEPKFNIHEKNNDWFLDISAASIRFRHPQSQIKPKNLPKTFFNPKKKDLSKYKTDS